MKDFGEILGKYRRLDEKSMGSIGLNSQKWIKSKRKCVNLEWEFGENEVPDVMRCLHGACRETSIGRVVYFSTKDA